VTGLSRSNTNSSQVRRFDTYLTQQCPEHVCIDFRGLHWFTSACPHLHR
jgi:hypothetical protein